MTQVELAALALAQKQAARRPMRPDETAAYLNVSASTLAKWRLRGTGPAYAKVSRRLVLYDPDDCDKWLDQRRVTSTSAARA